MARDDPPYSPSGPSGSREDAPGRPGEGAGGDAVLAAIAYRLRARSERQQLLTERLRSGELRPGALADLAELAGAARRGVRDGDHILVLAGAAQGHRPVTPPTPLGQALNTVVATSEAASRTVVPPTPSVSLDPTAEPVLGQILAELLAHAAGATPPGERLELHTRWGPDGGVVLELQCASAPQYRTPVDELDRALSTATPAGPVAPQEIGLHVAARLARAIGGRLGVRGPAGNTALTPVAVLALPSSVIGGGQAPAPAAETEPDRQLPPTTALPRPPAPAPGPPAEAPWPPPQHERAATAEDPVPDRAPPAPAASDGDAAAGGLPRRSARARPAGIAGATPFGAPEGRNGSTRAHGAAPEGQAGVDPFAPSGPAPTAPPPSPDATGQPGSAGQPGHAGHQGHAGQQGRAGQPGHAGQQGVPGQQGIPGQQGHPGQPGPTAQPGFPGQQGAERPSNGAPWPGAADGPARDDAQPVTEALPVSGAPGSPPPVELFGPFDSEVPVPVDDTDDPPIFAAVASAWFRESASPETTALPVNGGPSARAENWRTPGDAEFDAARIRADRVVDLPTTAQGLPQRLPGQAMVPPSWRETPNAQPSGSRERQPDRVRNRLASYQRGLKEGRHRAAEEHPEPVPQPVNGQPANGHTANRHGGHGLTGEGGRNAG